MSKCGTRYPDNIIVNSNHNIELYNIFKNPDVIDYMSNKNRPHLHDNDILIYCPGKIKSYGLPDILQKFIYKISKSLEFKLDADDNSYVLILVKGKYDHRKLNNHQIYLWLKSILDRYEITYNDDFSRIIIKDSYYGSKCEYIISKDGVDVIGNINLKNSDYGGLIPFKFNHIEGDFYALSEINMYNFPNTVSGIFHCRSNVIPLVSFEGCPKKVGDLLFPGHAITNCVDMPIVENNINFSHCNINCLNGLPKIVNGNLELDGTNIIDFSNGPETVTGNVRCYECKSLINLNGCPKIDGSLNLRGCELKSFNGLFNRLKGDLEYDFDISELDDVPDSVGGYFIFKVNGVYKKIKYLNRFKRKELKKMIANI